MKCFSWQVIAGVSDRSVTCGSLLKLVNGHQGVRLHSHDVKYGTGSGQQSVTGSQDVDDLNSHWLVKAETGAFCHRGPIIGQNEIVGVESPHGRETQWAAKEGVYFHTSDFDPKKHLHAHTEL
ncbi:hypothetical protein LSTR_LSTR003706 [Laodelphax striatellus]|uniref:MIR domain-containing protein n=1 Tax=Laodelphax striatellus TaxID=195883 RepID=A0A482WZQ9_LAOST|nr:hypothetical protein LSTR_LSTR003706 [Laodelphax striatellus]